MSARPQRSSVAAAWRQGIYLLALQQAPARGHCFNRVVIMGVHALSRVIWVCFQLVRLAVIIAGKIVAVDASVFRHAILSDEVVSQMLQGTDSIFAEVFAFMNVWCLNKCIGVAVVRERRSD
jgi:hypothetical protein